MPWRDITTSEQYQSLPPEQQISQKRAYFQERVLPAIRSERAFDVLPDADIEQLWLGMPDDSGQGYFTSLLSSAGRGAASIVPGAVGGLGYLTTSETLKQAGEDIEAGINEALPINPVYQDDWGVKGLNAAGQALGFFGTAGVGGLAGKTLGGVRAAGKALTAAEQAAALAKATNLGAQATGLGSGVLSGIREGGQTAEEYGVEGTAAWLQALGRGAIEGASEKLLFGLGTETAAARRLLGDTLEKGAGGFLKDTGTEAAEEVAAQVGGNVLTQGALAATGSEREGPGVFEGALEAGALGAVGGATFGTINALTGRYTRNPLPAEVAAETVGEDAFPEAEELVSQAIPTIAATAGAQEAQGVLDAVNDAARVSPTVESGVGEEFTYNDLGVAPETEGDLLADFGIEARPTPPRLSPEGVKTLGDEELAAEETRLSNTVNQLAVEATQARPTKTDQELLSLATTALETVRAERQRRQSVPTTGEVLISPESVPDFGYPQAGQDLQTIQDFEATAQPETVTPLATVSGSVLTPEQATQQETERLEDYIRGAVETLAVNEKQPPTTAQEKANLAATRLSLASALKELQDRGVDARPMVASEAQRRGLTPEGARQLLPGGAIALPESAPVTTAPTFPTAETQPPSYADLAAQAAAVASGEQAPQVSEPLRRMTETNLPEEAGPPVEDVRTPTVTTVPPAPITTESQPLIPADQREEALAGARAVAAPTGEVANPDIESVISAFSNSGGTERTLPGANTPVSQSDSGYNASPRWVHRGGFKNRAAPLVDRFFPQASIIGGAPAQSVSGTLILGNPTKPNSGYPIRVFLHELGHALASMRPELFNTPAVRRDIEALQRDDAYAQEVLEGRTNEYTLSPPEIVAEFNAARIALPALQNQYPALSGALDAAANSTTLNSLTAGELSALETIFDRKKAGYINELAKGGSPFDALYNAVMDAAESLDAEEIRRTMDAVRAADFQATFITADQRSVANLTADPSQMADTNRRLQVNALARGEADAKTVARLEDAGLAAAGKLTPEGEKYLYRRTPQPQQPDAVQEPSPAEGVLRQEGPEVELPRVAEEDLKARAEEEVNRMLTEGRGEITHPDGSVIRVTPSPKPGVATQITWFDPSGKPVRDQELEEGESFVNSLEYPRVVEARMAQLRPAITQLDTLGEELAALAANPGRNADKIIANARQTLDVVRQVGDAAVAEDAALGFRDILDSARSKKLREGLAPLVAEMTSPLTPVESEAKTGGMSDERPILPRTQNLRRGEVIRVLSGKFQGEQVVQGYDLSPGGNVYVEDPETGMHVPINAPWEKITPAQAEPTQTATLGTPTSGDVGTQPEAENAPQAPTPEPEVPASEAPPPSREAQMTAPVALKELKDLARGVDAASQNKGISLLRLLRADNLGVYKEVVKEAGLEGVPNPSVLQVWDAFRDVDTLMTTDPVTSDPQPRPKKAKAKKRDRYKLYGRRLDVPVNTEDARRATELEAATPGVSNALIDEADNLIAEAEEQGKDELLEALQAAKAADAEAFFFNDTAVVLTDQMAVYELDATLAKQNGTTPAVEAVRRVLRHENVGHRGWGGLPEHLRAQWLTVADELMSEEDADTIVSQGYREFADWRTNDASKAGVFEEWVSRQAENPVILANALKRPKQGSLRDFLRDLWNWLTGGNPDLLDPSDEQLVALVRDLLTYAGRAPAGRVMKPSLRQMVLGPVTPEMDRAYMDAVQRGDTAEAQRLVDEAAKAAGYDVGPVYRGDAAGDFNTFDKQKRGSAGRYKTSRLGFFFTPSERMARVFGRDVRRFFIRLSNPLPAHLSAQDQTEAFVDNLEASADIGGNDGYVSRSEGGDVLEYAVREPDQIKSADPITYDDQGNVVPLSQRFNPETPDIRFSRRALGTSLRDLMPQEPVPQTSIPDAYARAREGSSTAFISLGDILDQMSPGYPMAKFEQDIQRMVLDGTAMLEPVNEVVEGMITVRDPNTGQPGGWLYVPEQTPDIRFSIPKADDIRDRATAYHSATPDLTRSRRRPATPDATDRPIDPTTGFPQRAMAEKSSYDALKKFAIDTVKDLGDPGPAWREFINDTQQRRALGVTDDMMFAVYTEMLHQLDPTNRSLDPLREEVFSFLETGPGGASPSGSALSLINSVYKDPRYQHLFAQRGMRKLKDDQIQGIVGRFVNVPSAVAAVTKADADAQKEAAETVAGDIALEWELLEAGIDLTDPALREEILALNESLIYLAELNAPEVKASLGALSAAQRAERRSRVATMTAAQKAAEIERVQEEIAARMANITRMRAKGKRGKAKSAQEQAEDLLAQAGKQQTKRKPAPRPVRDAYRDQLRTPTSREEFVKTLTGLGVEAETAEKLFDTAAAKRVAVGMAKLTGRRNALLDLTPKTAPERTESKPRTIRGLLAKAKAELLPGKQWDSLFNHGLTTQREWRQQLFDKVRADEAFADLTDQEARDLAAELDRLWNEQRQKAVERDLKRMIPSGSKEVRERVAKATPALLKAINRGTFNDQKFREAVASKFGIGQLTEAEEARVSELAAMAQDEKLTAPERKQAGIDMVELLQKHTKLTKAEVISNYWVTSVLSGPRTLFDMAFNFLNGMRVFTQFSALALTKKGGATGAYRGFKDYVKGFTDAVGEALAYILTGDQSLLDSTERRLNAFFGEGTRAVPIDAWEKVMKDPKTPFWKAPYTYFLGTVQRMMIAFDHVTAVSTSEGLKSLAVTLNPSIYGDAQLPDANDIKAARETALAVVKAKRPDGESMSSLANRSRITAATRQILNEVYAKRYPALLDNVQDIGMVASFQNDPTGLGGYIYHGLLNLSNRLTQGAEKFKGATAERAQKKEQRYYEEMRAKGVEDPPPYRSDADIMFREAVSAFMLFTAVNSRNITGTRFVRFVGNKVNEMLSFLPGVGLVRRLEQTMDDNPLQRQLLYTNQVVGGMTSGALFVALMKLMNPEDDEEPWFMINGPWDYVKNFDQKNRLRDAGSSPNSIEIRNKDGSLTVFNYTNWPLSGLLAAAGNLMDMKRFNRETFDTYGVEKLLAAGLMATGGAVFDMNALSAFTNIFLNRDTFGRDPVGTTAEKLAKWAANFTGGFIPRMAKDIDLWLEPTYQRPNDWKDQFYKEVPFFRRDIAGTKAYNMFGEPVKVERQPWSRAVVTRPTEEHHRVARQLIDKGIFFSPPNPENRTVVQPGGMERREMTGAESEAYVVEAGRLYRDFFTEEGERVLSMPVDVAKKYIDERLRVFREQAFIQATRR